MEYFVFQKGLRSQFHILQQKYAVEDLFPKVPNLPRLLFEDRILLNGFQVHRDLSHEKLLLGGNFQIRHINLFINTYDAYFISLFLILRIKVLLLGPFQKRLLLATLFIVEVVEVSFDVFARAQG